MAIGSVLVFLQICQYAILCQYIGYPENLLSDNSWYAAEAYCIAQHCTHLASIHNQTEYNLVYNICNSMGDAYDCWIGLISGTDWTWSDESDNSYRNFESTFEQDKGTQSNICGHYDPPQSGWKGDDCGETNQFHFVCIQGSCVTTSTPTSNQPTNGPSNEPTLEPTTEPTQEPSMHPTIVPTFDPTYNPTLNPSTSDPTFNPTIDPTYNPTLGPSTFIPTINPSEAPSQIPTPNPTTPSPISNTIHSTSNDQEVDGTTTTQISNTESADSINESFVDRNEFLYIVIASIVAFIICLLLFLFLYLKRKKQEKQIKDGMEMARVTSTDQEMDIVPITNTSVDTANSSDENAENVQIVDDIDDPYSDSNALKMWLKNIDLLEYYELFIEQGFGDKMVALNALNNEDLREMGINKLAHRKVILENIKNNQQQIKDINDGMNTLNTTNISIDDDHDDDDNSNEQLFDKNINIDVTTADQDNITVVTPGIKGKVN